MSLLLRDCKQLSQQSRAQCNISRLLHGQRTFQSRLLLCRPLQERLQTLQDVLLPQEVKDFLCIVLQGQAFPGGGETEMLDSRSSLVRDSRRGRHLLSVFSIKTSSSSQKCSGIPSDSISAKLSPNTWPMHG